MDVCTGLARNEKNAAVQTNSLFFHNISRITVSCKSV